MQEQVLVDPETSMVRVPGRAGAAALSKAQTLFNRLIERIDQQRQLLAGWQDFVPRFAQRVAGELEPLQQRCARAQLALAKLFDAASDSSGITKRERAKLATLVRDICAQLLSDDDAVAAEIVTLHDKHSDTSHADLKDGETGHFKEMAQTLFRIDLDHSDAADSPEAIREALKRKLSQQRIAPAEPAAAPRHKSAKALARESKLAQEAQAATQSVREVFRKLASALHPDRESDQHERARKTALMQEVNQAYAQRDLLRLLELQIQAEQIDAAVLGSLSPTRLRHYNQVLTEQCAELEHEIAAVGARFVHQPGAFGRDGLTPQTVNRALDGDIAAMRRAAQRVEHDLNRLADLGVLRHG